MSTSLSAVLQDRLDRIDGGRSLVVSTMDGVELCAVSKVSENKSGRPGNEDLQFISQYSPACAATAEHVVKLGLGSPKYSINWLDDGILVQSKLEAAILSLYLEEYANLGLLDDQLDIIVKILQPFTTANFISTNL